MEYVSAEIWEKIPEDIKKMINFQLIRCYEWNKRLKNY